MKLTLLLNRHVLTLCPSFEHNWRTFVCTTLTEDWGSRNRHLSSCIRVFCKFGIL